jgi:glyoxylase-like metal-dependent hydrolase (beta-lactamase superfamily II)
MYKGNILIKLNSESKQIEDIFEIKVDVPFPVKFNRLYIIKVEGKNVLIDAGLNNASWINLFLFELHNLGFKATDIDFCIITHHHLDHIGMINTLRRKSPHTKIIMHDITKQTLHWETDKENLQEIKNQAIEMSYQMKRYGLSEDDRQRIIQYYTFWPKLRIFEEPDIIVHNGDKILNDLEVIWTPGHSFGHICIFDTKRKYLFSGDHILSRITPHIGNFIVPNFLFKQYKDYNFNNVLDQYLNSLDIIDNLNPKIIFPAHQEIIYNPHERIQEIKEHHRKRLREILDVIKNAPKTPFEISKIHFGNDLDDINSYMALSEVVGHLLYLEDKGLVHKNLKDGKLFYQS